jgi:hypothetical protein
MNNQLARVFALVALCGAGPAHSSQERLVPHPELLAGTWETARSGGVDGIFLSISTHVQTGPSATTTQDIHVRVYHRQAANETGGWYIARNVSRDEPAIFDGEHLQLRAVSNGPVIDLRFDPVKQRWTGTWTRNGQSQDVTLERPQHAPAATVNPLVGDWEGLPDSAAPWTAATRLHISESWDGVLTAWLDRIIAPIDQRHGELLQVAASDSRTIMLSTTPPGGMRFSFRGALSADGSTLVGTWPSETGDGGTLNAASTFRRTR